MHLFQFHPHPPCHQASNRVKMSLKHKFPQTSRLPRPTVMHTSDSIASTVLCHKCSPQMNIGADFCQIQPNLNRLALSGSETQSSHKSCSHQTQCRVQPPPQNTASKSYCSPLTSRSSHQPTLAIFCLIACLMLVTPDSVSSDTLSAAPVSSRHSHQLYSQLRHLLSEQNSHQRRHHHHHNQRKSHHYYHHQVSSSQVPQYRHASPNAHRSTSLAPLAPFYLFQQLVRQQKRTGRNTHPYYHNRPTEDNGANNTELNPILSQTYRRWSSRQAGARSLLNNSSYAKVIYQLNGIKSDDQLPVCETWQVCNKVDTYSSPWVEKQCRCPDGSKPCSQSLRIEDGHTIVDKTRQYKMCEPVNKLPTCRYFRDITWTITTTSAKSEHDLNSLLTSNSAHRHYHHQQQHSNSAENITRQEMKCVCPPNSVAYIFKHQVYKASDGQLGYRYHFACSPETKLRCKRKEPCRLFTARKRPKVEEVTTNTLCQCPGGYTCPANHRHQSVLIGTVYPLDNIRTYSGYCYPDHESPMNKQPEIDEDEDSIELKAKSTTNHHSNLDSIQKSHQQPNQVNKVMQQQ